LSLLAEEDLSAEELVRIRAAIAAAAPASPPEGPSLAEEA
jgi:hypothetical protein